MKEQDNNDAAMMEAYRIAAGKAEYLARTGAFALGSATNWEDHRQDAALAIAKKKGESKEYLTVTGLRALRYSHAAALREKYAATPQSAAQESGEDKCEDENEEEAEATPEQPSRQNGWIRWHRARFMLEEVAPALSWRTIHTFAAFLAEDMDYDAAAKRLGVSRATAYRMFLRAAKEFRNLRAKKLRSK